MENLNNITVTNILNASTVSSPRGRNVRITDRFSYGLSFCISGQITYTQNGEKYVSDKGCAVILPEGQNYELHGDKTGLFPVINFTCAEFLCDRITIIPISTPEAYINDFEQIKRLLLFKNNRLEIMSIFYRIIHRLNHPETAESSVLSPAVKYLEENFSDSEITNKTLADECNISEIYFRKLFTEIYGTTPRQFIISIRINKAKELLSGGTFKISAVAEECGFSNQYHFCRIFRDRVGVTPTEYMKENRIYKI